MQRIENIEEILIYNSMYYIVIEIKRKDEEVEVVKIEKPEPPLRELTYLIYPFKRNIEEEEKAKAFIEFLRVFNLLDKVEFSGKLLY